MKTCGIAAGLPAQDLGRAKGFYVEKIGRQAVGSEFLDASDGRRGLTVGDGVNRLYVYPAGVRSTGEFTQAVIQVADVRAADEAMRNLVGIVLVLASEKPWNRARQRKDAPG